MAEPWEAAAEVRLFLTWALCRHGFPFPGQTGSPGTAVPMLPEGSLRAEGWQAEKLRVKTLATELGDPQAEIQDSGKIRHPSPKLQTAGRGSGVASPGPDGWGCSSGPAGRGPSAGSQEEGAFPLPARRTGLVPGIQTPPRPRAHVAPPPWAGTPPTFSSAHMAWAGNRMMCSLVKITGPPLPSWASSKVWGAVRRTPAFPSPGPTLAPPTSPGLQRQPPPLPPSRFAPATG
ncbi:wiskott-Aldrich syndrome protein homolog [Choloepus didactylus]|uniref:wiskott-Aldrich syndrome protein homolog n=1 Tax=Choloepus didactylus TaxID=27675 RepID=UPI00189CB5C6|nr:wiskott-Aldrich syndrome protein homolog [Choloepus didactylus]